MQRNSYVFMQEILPVARNRSFTITGFVREIKNEIAFTRLTVLVDSLLKANSPGESIYVYFMDKAKIFVDSTVSIGNMVDIVGHINVSRKSQPNNQILKLEGKHVYVYRNVEPPYKSSVQVDYKNIDNKDLAF